MLLVLVRDLLFSSKIDAAAQRAGVEIAWVPRGAALADVVRERGAAAVLVDLGEPGAMAAVRDVLAERPQVHAIGFAGHLRTDLIEEARAIGVAEVLTRGQLNAGLADVLARASGAGATPG